MKSGKVYKKVLWTIQDLYDICRQRQARKLDVLIAWTGARGSGKSTGAFKLCRKFKNFKPKKHIIYTRQELLPLFEQNKFGTFMDDEAIRSAYKRNFADADQKILIQMLNMYRDHFNIYNLCIPNFYSLDKDLRNLIKIHIHVIERGKAIVHIAREDVLYSDDPWDIKYNQKIEDRWAKRKQLNTKFNPPFFKLTTFAGILKYTQLHPKWQKIYDEIKASKRKDVYDSEMKNSKSVEFDYVITAKRLYDAINVQKIMNEDDLKKYCIINKIPMTKMKYHLTREFKNNGTTLAKSLKAIKKLQDKDKNINPLTPLKIENIK